MRAPLPRLELAFYFAFWVVSFVYSFYKVYEGGRLLQLTRFEPQDFSDGFLQSIGEPYRDSSDYDWELWTTFLRRLLPWTALHLIVAETVRIFDPSSTPLAHSLVTLLALIAHFPPESTCALIFTLTLFSFSLVVRSKCLIWTLAVGLLLSVNFFSKYIFHAYQAKYEEIALSVLCFEWFLLKCIDFALIEIETTRSLSSKFVDLLGYAFYLPCFFLGPFVPYDNFRPGLRRQFHPWTRARLKKFAFGLIRVVGWFWIFETSAHFFYCHAMHFKVDHVVSLGRWTLNGVGLCMAQFFFVKYTVVYGGALTVARFELYDVPPNPKCVNRIHLYSNMWRHFDRGFYVFLMRCIYRPIVGSSKSSLCRRLIASFYCFCFVFLWHGINRTMLIWSTLNFVGIVFESIGKTAVDSSPIRRFRRAIGKSGCRRLEALACSPLWVMAVVSNYIFFGDYDLGTAYVRQILTADWPILIFVFLVGYCMCQISIEASNLDSKSMPSLTVTN